jgi:hypothetical protein
VKIRKEQQQGMYNCNKHERRKTRLFFADLTSQRYQNFTPKHASRSTMLSKKTV